MILLVGYRKIKCALFINPREYCNVSDVVLPVPKFASRFFLRVIKFIRMPTFSARRKSGTLAAKGLNKYTREKFSNDIITSDSSHFDSRCLTFIILGDYCKPKWRAFLRNHTIKMSFPFSPDKASKLISVKNKHHEFHSAGNNPDS